MPTPTIFEGINPRGTQTFIPCKDVSAFPRSEQAVLGAKNLLYTNEVTKTSQGITYTINRDSKGNVTSIDVSGANPTAWSGLEFWADIEPNVYKLSHMENALNFIWGEVILYKNGSQTQILYSIGTANDSTIDLSSYDFDRIKIVAKRVNDGTNTTATIYPMLRLATDTDSNYVPYAMTNEQLTDAVNGVFAWGDTYNGDYNDLPAGMVFAGSSASHKPDDWCIVKTYYKNGDRTDGFQTAYKINPTTPYIYVRAKASGSWGNWFKFTGVEQT